MSVVLKKYPRTAHLPWSPGASEDDIRLDVVRGLVGQEVVVTEKMDGENTTIYSGGHIHARSLDSAHHESRAWVKALAGRIAHDIPSGWRLCGENLYARHSIAYDDLKSYFVLFSVWHEDLCLSWEDTLLWAQLLDLQVAPQLYIGPYDEVILKSITSNLQLDRQEGIVVRDVGSFCREDFGEKVLKWVRSGHVQTEDHWMHRAVVPNRMR